MIAGFDFVRKHAREALASRTCSYCKEKGTHPFCEMVKKVIKMSNEELFEAWSSVGIYGPDDYYDKPNGISMESWYNALYEEVCKRKI